MPRECCKRLAARVSDDVPTFQLVGYDSLAIQTIEFWLKRAKAVAVNPFKIEVATAHLNDFKRFAKQYPERMKIPD